MPLFRGTFFLKSADLSVSVFCENHLKKHTDLWVPFWETIAKLLGGRLSIKKMSVQLEIKV